MVFSALLLPLSLYPFIGTLVAAGFKAMGTAQHLHKPVRSYNFPLITPLILYPLKVFQSKEDDTPRDCSIR